jgi:hypothetical protein
MDGGGCPLLNLGSSACNTCATQNCCSQASVCNQPDEAGVTEAGSSACGELATCVSACLVGNPEAGVDGGTLPGCLDSCNPSHIYNVTQVTNAQILLACLSNSCPTSCR